MNKNIYICWASIRPHAVKEVSKEWLENCVFKENLYWKIAMASEEQKAEVEALNIPNCDVIAVTDKVSYNHAITQITLNLEMNDEDILIVVSDDMYCFSGWDMYLRQRFEEWQGAIFINDGCGIYSRIITLACMTFACIKKLNKIIYHPVYTHFYSDDEAYWNLLELGLLQDNRSLQDEHGNFIDPAYFQHKHYGTDGTRPDIHDNRYKQSYTTDGHIFHKRRNMPIHERLKL